MGSKSIKLGFIVAIILVSWQLVGQEKKQYKIHTVAFYNLENLFDTINDPLKNDEASPIMELKQSPRQHRHYALTYGVRLPGRRENNP